MTCRDCPGLLCNIQNIRLVIVHSAGQLLLVPTMLPTLEFLTSVVSCHRMVNNLSDKTILTSQAAVLAKVLRLRWDSVDRSRCRASTSAAASTSTT